MLKNNSNKQPRRDNSEAIANSIPDPWLITNQVQKQKTIPEDWQLPKEPNTAGCLGVPILASHQLTSEEILLEDELKLNTASSFLKQVEQALALIYWLKTTKRSNYSW